MGLFAALTNRLVASGVSRFFNGVAQTRLPTRPGNLRSLCVRDDCNGNGVQWPSNPGPFKTYTPEELGDVAGARLAKLNPKALSPDQNGTVQETIVATVRLNGKELDFIELQSKWVKNYMQVSGCSQQKAIDAFSLAQKWRTYHE